MGQWSEAMAGRCFTLAVENRSPQSPLHKALSNLADRRVSGVRPLDQVCDAPANSTSRKSISSIQSLNRAYLRLVSEHALLRSQS